MTTQTKSTSKGTSAAASSPVVKTLNGRLADLIDLHWQLKQAHWNVTGANFIAVHDLFDVQAAMTRTMADALAERARALLAPAEGTIRMAVERTTLDEFPAGAIDWSKAIETLTQRYEHFSGLLKDASDEAAAADDKATEDLYVGMIQEIDKAAYFLRSHLS